MSADSESSWASRVRRTISEVLGGLELPELPAPGEDLEVLRASLETWLDGSGLRAFVAGEGRDQVAPPGQQVTLTVSLTRLARMRAERVRFFVGEEAVGEVAVGNSNTVSLPYCAAREGIFTIGFEPLDAEGRPGSRAASARLHVLPRARPLAAVDVGRLLAGDPEVIEACQRLVAEGWSLVYLDLGEVSRAEPVRASLARHGLPDGAVLDHPLEPSEFDALGVDFRPVFLANTLRTIRAHGLSLGLLVAESDAPWPLVEAESIPRLAPGELARRLDTAAGRAELRGPAERLARAWTSRRSDLEYRLDVMSNAGRRDGNRFTVELDNRAARLRTLSLIRGAERRVHVQFYIFEAGAFTDALVDALVERAEAGVTVRLVVDALYSQEDLLGLANAALDRLRGVPNAEVVASDPIPGPELIEALALRQRDHRKLLIVDEQIGIVSGRNAADAYFLGFDEVEVDDKTPHDVIPWFDAHVEVQGPLVADIDRTFVDNWNRNTQQELARPVAGPEPAGQSPGRLVVHDGVRDADGLGAYVALLDGAESHVYIVNDFPVVATLADAMQRALARGVRVVFLTGNAVPRTVEGKLFDGPMHRTMFEYMTKHRLEPLLVAGAEGYELRTPRLDNIRLPGQAYRPYVHAKVVSVDGRAASIGSANLDVTASYWEREANVVIECPEVVGALEAQLEEWRASAFRLRLDDEYWRAEAVQRDLTARLWWDLVYPA